MDVVEGDDDTPEDGINFSIINEVKLRRHLWDSRHKLYKDSEMKKKSWIEMARKLGVKELFLKTRWRSLRDRYMKERRREISIAKTGQIRRNRPWAMMHSLDFLQKAVSASRPSRKAAKECKEESRDEDDIEPPGPDNADVLSETFESEDATSVQNVPTQNVPTYLIINPDNTIQSLSLPGVALPVAKNTRPFRRIEPATSESPRNVAITTPASTSVAGSSGTQVQSIKPIPRLAPAPLMQASPQETKRSFKPDPLQPAEAESSERYFYLSIAKEMESRSTRTRLKMRKIISDALLELYEDEEAQE